MDKQNALTREQIKNMENPIFSIDHVQIPIKGDLRQAAEWYQSLFGVGDSLPSPDDDTWFAGIPTVRGNIFLWKTNDHSSNTSFTREGSEFPIIMFKTFQIDELYKRLFESGCRISSFDPPTEDNINQFRFLKFYDKWGNMLGFIQDPPTVPWYGVK